MPNPANPAPAPRIMKTIENPTTKLRE